MKALNEKYLNHKIFERLIEYSEFYNRLALHTFHWTSQGTRTLLNMDTYVYSSMQGTLESIHDVLKRGRINDAYTLLRKFCDSTIINVYSNLYLQDHFSIENFVVAKIENWRTGKEQIPYYGTMSQYIKNSPKLAPVNSLLNPTKKLYQEIRERCNMHTHYNFYATLLLNDNEVNITDDRIKSLDQFSQDVEDVFIRHLSYIFYLMDHYMMASDYIDSLNIGMPPEEGSENFVEPFIQNMLNKVVRAKRPDLYDLVKENTDRMLD